MDLGSGITFQTKTVNGKSVPGIYFGNSVKATRKPKFPIRSVVEADEKPKNGVESGKNVKNSKSFERIRTKKVARNQSAKGTPPQVKKDDTPASDGEKNGDATKVQRVKIKGKKDPDRGSVTRKPAAENKTKKKDNEIVTKQEDVEKAEVDTKYVTLTQDQLSTILSLVKSKNDIDVSNVLEEKEEGSNDDKDGEEPENLKSAGEDSQDAVGSSSRPGSQKSKREKSDESIMNLLKNDKKGKKQKQDEAEKLESEGAGKYDGRKSAENLPAAIRSSFFLGEAAPREHAFSAKKRKEQQRWREELDKQRSEQREKRESEKKDKFNIDEQDQWSRHFDTMLPGKKSLVKSFEAKSLDLSSSEFKNVGVRNSTELKSGSDNAVGVGRQFKKNERGNTGEAPNKGGDVRNLDVGDDENTVSSTVHNSGNMSMPFPSAGVKNSDENLRRNPENDDFANGDFASTFTNTSIPQRSSHLRTMTSLLDPAQIEALEVKRRKQEEHRRAIEAQVEERRRKKEEELKMHRRMEAEEDKRLAVERDSLAQKSETEKLRQQMQENMREQKTKELYQQMQNAAESALRDKLSKREQHLKNKGHDTTRLERTHQMTLGRSHHSMAPEPTVAQVSQTSLISNSSLIPGVSALHIPQEGYASTNISPRMVARTSPVAVMAQTEQGPIKLEISLNPQKSVELVESGVQTDGETSYPRSLLHDSDDESEYMRLPRQRQKGVKNEREKKGKNPRLEKFERNLDQQYEKHSRTVAQQRRKKNEERPKWGVGGNNKTYKPASQRYTLEQQKRDPVMRKREERATEPEPIVTRFKNPSNENRPKSPVIPAVRNRQNRDGRKQRTNAELRPSSGIYATTDNAKYRSEKHTRESPVPETKEFVQYRRTTAVLDPNQPQSRPETGPMESQADFVQRVPAAATGAGDPLLNPNVVHQHERQDQILREIEILRQGLLIKQREIASYPVTMTHSMAVLPPSGVVPTNLVLAGGGNLPERTNDTPL